MVKVSISFRTRSNYSGLNSEEPCETECTVSPMFHKFIARKKETKSCYMFFNGQGHEMHAMLSTPDEENQNWNCISEAYPRASRCAAMALFIGGGPHLNIWKSARNTSNHLSSFYAMISKRKYHNFGVMG